MRKMLTWISGEVGAGTRRSTKTTSSTTPSRDAHARWRDCSSPRWTTAGSRTRSTPTPDATRTSPGSPCGRPVDSDGLGDRDQDQRDDRDRNVHPEDRPPGPLRQQPPRTGPIAVRPPAMPKKSASALPRWRSSKVCTTIASAAGNMIAPPAPWMTRNATIHASAKLPSASARTSPMRRRTRRRRASPSCGARPCRPADRRTRTAPPATADRR